MSQVTEAVKVGMDCPSACKNRKKYYRRSRSWAMTKHKDSPTNWCPNTSRFSKYANASCVREEGEEGNEANVSTTRGTDIPEDLQTA